MSATTASKEVDSVSHTLKYTHSYIFSSFPSLIVYTTAFFSCKFIFVRKIFPFLESDPSVGLECLYIA